MVKFEDTTSKGLESMINGGESQYDMTVAYEVNAVSAVDKGTTNIQVVYTDRGSGLPRRHPQGPLGNK